MMKIAHITDIHLEEGFPLKYRIDAYRNLESVLQDALERNIDRIIIGGDLGNTASNKAFFSTLKKYDEQAEIVLGNHDTYAGISMHYSHHLNQGKGKLYYSYDERSFRFVFMDSSSGITDKEQMEWLRHQLDTDKKLLVFIHHPVLDSYSLMDRKYALNGREAVQEIFSAHKNEVYIFCGHYHMGDERTHGNIRQYISPAVSYQVEKDPEQIRINNSNFGYRIIELNGDELRTHIVEFKTLLNEGGL
ncbi:metallophosphoesterase [Leptobacterium flavescens]|uniref:Metallophosphoesterase n=1 Tax=Leptobacterium flavescens TaxID=472055 RepID=A0A6P0UL38_9FLAO|nr:metallophosphoesterase [Leptobacterium flavescens]NER13687.1 metallophosphoesterase [Leptobacterium flavescens]